jgi:hypothetical protein
MGKVQRLEKYVVCTWKAARLNSVRLIESISVLIQPSITDRVYVLCLVIYVQSKSYGKVSRRFFWTHIFECKALL